jgi:repressor LexA
MNFAKNLIGARKKIGISQGELARRLGVSQGTIGNYEAGTRYPRLDKLECIAEALETTV